MAVDIGIDSGNCKCSGVRKRERGCAERTVSGGI